MRDTLALIAGLKRLDSKQLKKLLVTRFTPATKPRSGYVEIAKALLEKPNITLGLQGLTSSEITRLLELGEPDAKLHTQSKERSLLESGLVGLIDNQMVELEAVRRELNKLIQGLPSGDAFDLYSGLENSWDHEDWATVAFLSTQQCVLIIHLLAQESFEVTKNGRLSKSAIQQLSEHDAVNEASLQILMHVLELLEMVAVQKAHTLVPTPKARAWASLPAPERWLQLVKDLLSFSPKELQENLQNSLNFSVALNHAISSYPLLPGPRRLELTRYLSALETVAASKSGDPTPAIQLLLEGEERRALDLAQSQFPDAGASVFILPDFSVIASGPLEPEIGLKLLQLADTSTVGLASTFRISETSLKRALASGWEPEMVHDFFKTISITPLPQPLEYTLLKLRDFPASEHRNQSVEHPECYGPLEAEKSRDNDSDAWAQEIAEATFSSASSTPDESWVPILRMAVAKKLILNVDVCYREGTRKITATALSISKDRLRLREEHREVEHVLPLGKISRIEVYPDPLKGETVRLEK